MNNKTKFTFEKKIYLLPKYNDLDIYRKTTNEALEYLEEYELKEFTEKAIKEKIYEFNKEYKKNLFEKLKIKDFIFLEATIYKTGNYKFAKINSIDIIKND